jgi:hypothetical protein
MDASGSVSITGSSGLRAGRSLRRAAFRTLKIAVFAPMAIAKVPTATVVELLFLANIRRANGSRVAGELYL